MKVMFDSKWWDVKPISNTKLGPGFEIDFTEMYDPPGLSYAVMQKISEMFGTKEIDFDNSIAERGCETCDHGSKYGYLIEIYRATKNPCVDGSAEDD